MDFLRETKLKKIISLLMLLLSVFVVWKFLSFSENRKLFYPGILSVMSIVGKAEREDTNKNVVNLSKTIKVNFFEEALFNKSIEYSSGKTSPIKAKISGGIIPHHLLASSFIAELIKYMAESKPARVMLIGPNHYETANYAVLSSSSDWETPFGALKGDRSLQSKIDGYSFIGTDDKVLENEHSVSGVMPFIKYFMPDAVVMPFVISKNIGFNDLVRFSDFLAKNFNKDSVILASVDFSHYLKYQDARENDKKTLNLIEEFDYKSLLELDSDYLDSPPAVAALLMALEKMNMKRYSVVDHRNSAEILNDWESQSTSYYTIMFYQ